MSEELAQIIMSPESFDGGPVSCGPNAVYAARTADAILAAGYRKPRTITTLEELDALEVGAVVRGKWLAEKWATPEGDVWFIAGRNMEWFTDDLVLRGGLPAEVLQESR